MQHTAALGTATMQHPLLQTKYMILTDFGFGFGLGNGSDPLDTFSDACAAWADQMDQNNQSWVIEVKLNAAVVDLTDEARAKCIRWHAENDSDLPDWLIDVPSDEADAPDQRGYDAAKEAA
jgi:hypothetical protein